MKKAKKKTAPVVPATNVSGSELARRMALEALNSCHRDREAARRLFKQWLRENEDLLEAVSGQSITYLITYALSHDIQVERRDVLKMSRALPIIESGISVGESVLPPRTVCIPIPSAQADARRAARLVKHSGLLAWPLPVTGKQLGDARPWEAKDGSLWYGGQRRGFGEKEHFLAFVWQACPDKDLPASKQRTIAEQLDLNTLRRLDERARIAEARKMLGSGEPDAVQVSP